MKAVKKIIPGTILLIIISFVFLLTIYCSAMMSKITVNLYPTYRKYNVNKKIKELLNNGCYSKEVCDSVTLYCDTVDQRVIDIVDCCVNSCLPKVMDDLCYYPQEEINIAILKEEQNIRIVLGDYDTASCTGAYFRGIILILEPLDCEKCSSDFVEQFTKNGPVVHELAHYIVDYKTNGNKPIWFTEGIALMEEWRINNALGNYNVDYDSYYSPHELHYNFYELEPIKAYSQSFKVVNFIASEYGLESLSNIMEKLSEGHTMNSAVKRELGMDLYELFNKCLYN